MPGQAASDEASLQMTEVAHGVSLPFYGSKNPTSAFQEKGLGIILSDSTSAYSFPQAGIPNLGFMYAGQTLAAQLALSSASGYNSFSPGIGVALSQSLLLGAMASFQASPYQWNNAKLFLNSVSARGLSLGLRAGIAVVTNAIDEIALGAAQSWDNTKLALDLQADGTLGTLRLMPAVVKKWGSFELSLSGSLARSSNWTLYADKARLALGLALGKSAFVRSYYETSYVAGLAVALIL